MRAEVDRVDGHAVRLGDDVVPEAAQRDCGRDLLRDRHLAQVGASLRGVAQPGGTSCPPARACTGVDEREQRLEHVRAPLEDVDEEDPAGPSGVVAALDADERRDRMRPSGSSR